MSQPIATKSLKIIQYFKDHPTADVKKVAAKFKTALPKTYVLRKRAREESWQPPSLVPMPEAPAPTNVDKVLDARAANYGKFIEGAEIMQMTKRLVHGYIEKRGTPLAFDQREALDMILHKMGRIINGNPDVVDHWTDIAGYAKLVADRLEGKVR
jgi:hypothetical protein